MKPSLLFVCIHPPSFIREVTEGGTTMRLKAKTHNQEYITLVSCHKPALPPPRAIKMSSQATTTPTTTTISLMDSIYHVVNQRRHARQKAVQLLLTGACAAVALVVVYYWQSRNSNPHGNPFPKSVQNAWYLFLAVTAMGVALALVLMGTICCRNRDEQYPALLASLVAAAVAHVACAEWYLVTAVRSVGVHWTAWILAPMPGIVWILAMLATRHYYVLQIESIYHALPLSFSEFTEF